MTIADPTTSDKARVDARGRLTVVARPLGGTPCHAVSSSGSPIFIPPPGKTTLVVGSLTFISRSGTAELLDLILYSDRSCSTIASVVAHVLVPAVDTTHLDYSEPLVLAPGPGDSSWCFANDNADVDVSAVGFFY